MPVNAPADFHPAFVSCFDSADVPGLLDLYGDEIVTVAEPQSRLQGKEQLQAALEGFLAVNPGPLSFPLGGLVEGPTNAVLYGQWSVDGTGPDGPVHLEGNATIVLAKREHGWVAVLDDFFTQG